LIDVARVLAAVGLGLLAGCGDGARLDSLAAGERGRVAWVGSGGVFGLESGLVVRLAGLEPPGRDQPEAAEALADLRRLVDGREVELHYGGARRDAYGRALAQVRLTGGRAWVQCALLRDGMARVRTYADNRALARPMLDCEAHARQRRLGLWRAPGDQVRLPGEIDAAAAGFQIVEGRVARATATRAGVYLDFTDAQAGFAVQVAGRAAPDLRKAGLAPLDLAGRLVRVRGLVGADGLMRVDHPEQIELLNAR
jgi:endonuclease YncB( thermonuclease family)